MRSWASCKRSIRVIASLSSWSHDAAVPAARYLFVGVEGPAEKQSIEKSKGPIRRTVRTPPMQLWGAQVALIPLMGETQTQSLRLRLAQRLQSNRTNASHYSNRNYGPAGP